MEPTINTPQVAAPFEKRKFRIFKYRVEKNREEGSTIFWGAKIEAIMYCIEVDGNGSGEKIWFYEEGIRYTGHQIITPIESLGEQTIEL